MIIVVHEETDQIIDGLKIYFKKKEAVIYKGNWKLTDQYMLKQ